MRWWLYNVLFGIAFVLLLPRHLLRMARRGGYREGFIQRFARYSPVLQARLDQRQRVWIHAVSVGELFVAMRLLDDLRTRMPGIGFVVTTNTSTGHRLAMERLNPDDVLLYVPLDFPPVMRRALDRMRPLAVLLTECELWPNLIRLASGRGIPVALVNGRISPSSYRGYRRIPCFIRPTVGALTRLLVQTEGDAQRLRELGAVPDRVLVTGTAKYDMTPSPTVVSGPREWLTRHGVSLVDPVLVGGSTWAGEESALLASWRELRPTVPGLRLVLVPRHAERGDEVVALVREAGLSPIRRSQDPVHNTTPGDVFVADSTGELAGFYGCATVVFVGKSLTAQGGQNFIEPALLGKAVITGPHLQNFPGVAEEFMAADAFVQVQDAAALTAALRRLLQDASAREALGARAAALVASRRGSVARTADALVQMMAANPAAGVHEA